MAEVTYAMSNGIMGAHENDWAVAAAESDAKLEPRPAEGEAKSTRVTNEVRQTIWVVLGKKVRVIQRRRPGTNHKRRVLAALGLRRIGAWRFVDKEQPSIQGMLHSIGHLIEIDESSGPDIIVPCVHVRRFSRTSTEQSGHEEKRAFGPSEWIVDEIYEQFLQDPHSVDRAWWDFFADYMPGIDLDSPAKARYSTLVEMWPLSTLTESWEFSSGEYIKVTRTGKVTAIAWSTEAPLRRVLGSKSLLPIDLSVAPSAGELAWKSSEEVVEDSATKAVQQARRKPSEVSFMRLDHVGFSLTWLMEIVDQRHRRQLGIIAHNPDIEQYSPFISATATTNVSRAVCRISLND
ncbi:Ribosomal protein L30, ferredoxin-like fold domain-containing protein [Actinobacteria bacterium OV320]|nr:Ribosomal protein L30, ferredoxin-like fold domain-containing protein [Actinobacteria bacterium OV320]